ncbi:helix-turn-helix domain-containing protein [Dyella sp. 20L07]|uniref:helix-turn-helix domain-containing protein n=1 Tax=Dyella sp. 20L07 TaxID=3384240 RepID=UPI003D26F8FF
MNSLTLLDFVFTAVMLGTSALAAALAFGMKRTRASSCLAVYFTCIVVDSIVSLTIGGWRDGLSANDVRWLHAVNIPVAYLLGPLLYGYVVGLTSAPTPLSTRRHAWHLAPYGVMLVISLANALHPFDINAVGAIVFKVTHHAWVVLGLIYLAAAVQLTYRSRPLLEQANADEMALRLTWLRRLVALIAVIWMLLAIDRLSTVTGIKEGPLLSTLLGVFTVVALYILAWFGLRQRALVPVELTGLERAGAPISQAPYARSGLENAQCADVATDLSRLMLDEQLYADSHFDLRALSQRSGWSPNYISQALNQGLGQNFFEFVNGFRIAAAERCLADPTDQRTILDIGLACGFGSKSTFNAVFKRMTDRTPSEYRRTSLTPPGRKTVQASDPARLDAYRGKH